MQHEPTLRRYRELLDEASARACGERLQAAVAREGLTWAGGNPIAKALQPYFIAQSVYEAAQRDARRVASAIYKTVDYLREFPGAREELGLTHPSIEMLLAFEEARVARRAKYRRLDGFWGSDARLHFVEYNTTPAGPAFCSVVSREFDQTPAVAALRKTVDCDWVDTHAHAVRALRAMHEDTFPGELWSIAAVPLTDYGAQELSEFANEAQRIAESLQAQGATVVVVSIDGFELRDGVLYADGTPVRYVMATPEALFGEGFAHPVIRAFMAGVAQPLDSLAYSAVGAMKSLLAGITDPDFALYLDDEEEACVEACVPWTRLVRETDTSFRGQHGNLLELAEEHRERLVVKEMASLGGKNVTLGWHCNEVEWRTALAEAVSAGSYILQERVEIPSTQVPVWRNGEMVWEERYLSYDPFVYYPNEPAGAWVRSSTQEVINLTQGGDMLPLCVVKGC